MTRDRFAERLLAWYQAHARELPWRERRDPWATWVSEVMLQQTRVDVVAPRFVEFLARFPTPAHFAIADDDTLLQAWRGLGYYRRARLLRDGAREVVAHFGGRVPADPDAIGSLAGVGDYTRGAIASIAFGHAEPAIDGNVERVFARHAGITDEVKRAATRARIHALVVSHMPTAEPGAFNQALMDLGATICTPRTPKCGDCPLTVDCEARRLGLQSELPRLPARRTTVDVHARAVIVRHRDGRALGARIDAGSINQGQVELPGPGVLVHHPQSGAALTLELARRYDTRFAIGDVIARVRHGITHHRIALEVHAARLVGRLGGSLSWFAIDAAAVPWSTPSRKALRAVARLQLTD